MIKTKAKTDKNSRKTKMVNLLMKIEKSKKAKSRSYFTSPYIYSKVIRDE